MTHRVVLREVVRVRVVRGALVALVPYEVSISVVGPSLLLLLVVDGVGPALRGLLLQLLLGIARLVLLIDDLAGVIVVLIHTLLDQVVRTTLRVLVEVELLSFGVIISPVLILGLLGGLTLRILLIFD